MTTIARVTADGLLRFRNETLRCAFGAAGLRADKREGDGATPCGLLPLRRVLFRADRGPRPLAAVPVEPIDPEDGWCDDPGHPDYNRKVRLPHPARHERLWREDALYDVVGVLGWNDAPVVRGRGARSSCISRAPVCRRPKAASPCRPPICAGCSPPGLRRSRSWPDLTERTALGYIPRHDGAPRCARPRPGTRGARARPRPTGGAADGGRRRPRARGQE